MNEYFLANQKRFIKRFVSGLKMRRLDRRVDKADADEMLLFSALRDERLRLPWFLEYYRSLGVAHFYLVDNGSSDGSVEYLLDQPDVCLWQTHEAYKRQEAWIDWLLHKAGRHHWCVLVDIDEMLIYPHQHELTLKQFCAFMEAFGYTALHSLLLDMYPAGSLDAAKYSAGQDPLEVACYYDPASHKKSPFQFHNCRTDQDFRYAGGLRSRVFGLTESCCSKFPLVHFKPGLFVRRGTHAVEGASIPALQGVLLHFKFLQDFAERTKYEVKREAHWQGAREYKQYLRKLIEVDRFTLAFSNSVHFTGAHEFLDQGLLRSNEDLKQFVRQSNTGQ